MVQEASLGNATEALKEIALPDLPLVNSNQSVIKISVEENTDVMNDSNASDKVYLLQKRIDPLTAIIGVPGAAGVAYLVLNNLSNMETVVRNTWRFVLKKCFHKGTKLKNGGCMSPDGTSIDWNGEILEFNQETIHVFCYSPNVKQSITIAGQRVIHNGVLIVQDNTRNDELHEEPKYQKCDDGSLWYTNLRVGDEMTEEEIKQFREFQVTLLEQKKKAMKRIYTRYGAMQKKAISTVKGSGTSSDGSSRGRTSSPDRSSHGKLEKSDTMSNFEDVDDSGYDSVKVDELLDKAFGRPEIADNVGTACGLFNEGGQVQAPVAPFSFRRTSTRSMTPRSRAFFTELLGRVKSSLSYSRGTSTPRSKTSSPFGIKRFRDIFSGKKRPPSTSVGQF